LKLSPMSSASRPIWYDGCAMEKLFARRLDMSLHQIDAGIITTSVPLL
jgi:hypothetical protein